MASAPNWIWDLLACPECGSPLVEDPANGQAVCTHAACGFKATYRGRRFDLLPRELDQHQRAEHDWRAAHYARLRRSVPQMSAPQFTSFKLLDMLTYYSFTSQFSFFRDYFAKKYHLQGRGLEVGGASGQLSGLVKLFYPATEMITSDVAPVNVTMAEELAAFVHFTTDYFVLADAERLPFRPTSFDFLCSSGMLHHLGDMGRALAQGQKLLKPGGRWYIVNELSIGALPRLFWNSRLGQKGQWAHQTGIRERSYTLTEWRKAFVQHGFRIVDQHFHRNPKHKLLSWPRALYYATIAKLPAGFIRAGLPCEVNFVLEKR